MTEQHLITPPQENTMASDEPIIYTSAIGKATIRALRSEKTVPDAYRLTTKGDGNGNIVYVLQGYFTWTQGWDQRGGEWRDLETQDWLTAQDDVPFSALL